MNLELRGMYVERWSVGKAELRAGACCRVCGIGVFSLFNIDGARVFSGE